MTKNQIDWWKLQEDKRHNRATEAETHRTNYANESLIQWRDTNTLDVRRGELGEVIRSNKAREQETARSNIAREQETVRSNKAHETEMHRHNVATEGIGNRQIALGYAQLAETTRSNMMREAISERANELSAERNTIQSDYNEAMVLKGYGELEREDARIRELQRHNQEMERLADRGQFVDLGGDLWRGLSGIASSVLK